VLVERTGKSTDDVTCNGGLFCDDQGLHRGTP
jgi:hypothetical protein